jgi:hypothetical protein
LSGHVATADVVRATPVSSLPRDHLLNGLGLGAVLELLPAELIDAAVAECGRQQQRVRLLPARIAVYFTLALWFCPGQGYAEVLRVLFRQLQDLQGRFWQVPTVSAAVKARHRIGPAPLKRMFQSLRGPHAGTDEPGMSQFGLQVRLLNAAVDGTQLQVPDTPANRAAFGQPPRTGRKVTGPYPKIRLLTLIACGTRTIIDAAWGPFADGELTLLRKLVTRQALHPGMLILADRYFSGHPQVAQITATGADLIIRVQQRRRLPVLTELPDGSYLSILPAANLPSRAQHQRAAGGHARRKSVKKRQAAGIRVRVVEAEVTVTSEHGQTRTESYRLITTLLDPAHAPADQIAVLYHERWESETSFAELKTSLRGGPKAVLRSKTPDGVAQEIYALLIVYQIVQITRIRAARDHPEHGHIDPDRISFTITLRALHANLTRPPTTANSLHHTLQEIWGHPLLERRNRSKPRERKGTAAFDRAIEQTPPGTVTYNITTRKPPNTP